MDDLRTYEAHSDSRTALSYSLSGHEPGVKYHIEIEYIPADMHVDPADLEDAIQEDIREIEASNVMERLDASIDTVYRGLEEALNPEYLGIRLEAEPLWGEDTATLEHVDSLTLTTEEETALFQEDE
ncbi:MAG: hypothetical protein SVU32_09120 [Candidatus Nanohaloarchaea archaeon]|nr:hypothetical protein [Candidatus Nanohaloarchaea archaeon]